MSAGGGGSAAKSAPLAMHPGTWVPQQQGQRVVDVIRHVAVEVAAEQGAEQGAKRRLRVALPPVRALALMMEMVLLSAFSTLNTLSASGRARAAPSICDYPTHLHFSNTPIESIYCITKHLLVVLRVCE